MNQQIIQKLPEDLINQIKAGEVVERPASVVKELVENSIDAQSTAIFVELLDGGKQLIRITDNGAGISANSLHLALERHATSKLKNFSDLEKIASFGFRGEALPSISSVSEFLIKSKPENQPLGKEITVSKGKITSEKDVHMPSHGTVIQAKDLFNNVPARLKFLKSTSTEYSHIHDFLLAFSFYYSHISFRLNHNGRDIFYYKQKDSSQKRLEEILGIESRDYAPVYFERGSFKVTGFALLPEKATSLPQHFITFVNGRLVKDKIIRAGVLQAYQGLLIKGLLPSCIIFIDVDPTWMDVNVHPAKIEVRFTDPMTIQELIAIGVQDSIKSQINKSLKNINTPSLELQPEEKNSAPSTPEAGHKIYSQNPFKEKQIIEVKNSHYNYKNNFITEKEDKPSKSFTHLNNLKTDTNTFLEKKEQPNSFELFQDAHKSIFRNAKYLGQFSNCYLILENEGQLWIIDQHAFHERILYEEYLREYSKQNISKQSLLTPIIVPCSESIASLARDYEDKINTLGFEIEILTNSNIAIHSYPSFLSTQKINSSFEEILNKIQQHESLQPNQIYHLFYSTLACHSAVRAGDPLNAELVHRLLERSSNVDFFAHCPHGRPVIRKFEKKDVESWFLRI
jgi:DNA mismatch repair protein MutL